MSDVLNDLFLNIDGYIGAIRNLTDESTVDYEQIYCYLDCILDEVEDAKSVVFGLIDEEEIENE